MFKQLKFPLLFYLGILGILILPFSPLTAQSQKEGSFEFQDFFHPLPSNWMILKDPHASNHTVVAISESYKKGMAVKELEEEGEYYIWIKMRRIYNTEARARLIANDTVLFEFPSDHFGCSSFLRWVYIGKLPLKKGMNKFEIEKINPLDKTHHVTLYFDTFFISKDQEPLQSVWDMKRIYNFVFMGTLCILFFLVCFLSLPEPKNRMFKNPLFHVFLLAGLVILGSLFFYSTEGTYWHYQIIHRSRTLFNLYAQWQDGAYQYIYPPLMAYFITLLRPLYDVFHIESLTLASNVLYKLLWFPFSVLTAVWLHKWLNLKSALLWIVNPLTIYATMAGFEDVGIVTWCLTATAYSLHKKDFFKSALFLGISFAAKPACLMMLIPFLMICYRNLKPKEMIKCLMILSVPFLMVSLPYLLLNTTPFLSVIQESIFQREGLKLGIILDNVLHFKDPQYYGLVPVLTIIYLYFVWHFATSHLKVLLLLPSFMIYMGLGAADALILKTFVVFQPLLILFSVQYKHSKLYFFYIACYMGLLLFDHDIYTELSHFFFSESWVLYGFPVDLSLWISNPKVAEYYAALFRSTLMGLTLIYLYLIIEKIVKDRLPNSKS